MYQTLSLEGSLRAPRRRRRFAGGERRSRVLQGPLKLHDAWMRAAKHAPRDRCHVLKRRYGLVEIAECGAFVIVERCRVITPHPEREII